MAEGPPGGTMRGGQNSIDPVRWRLFAGLRAV